MKIGHKIILFYSILTAIILITLSVSVYFFSQYYSQKMFYRLLTDRAFIAAQMFLKEDEMEKEVHRLIEKEYLKPLDSEKITILDSTNSFCFLKEQGQIFSSEILKKVREQREFEFEIDGCQAVGIHYSDNQGFFVIIVSAFDNYGKQKLDRLKIFLFGGTIISLFLIVAVGKISSSTFLKPFHKIILETNKIRASNLHNRLNVSRGNDEISKLEQTINQMLDRLESSFTMQRNFINNASHELKNPLTAMLGQMEVALTKSRSIEEYQNVLVTVFRETERLDYLISALLNLSQDNFDNVQMNNQIRIDELIFDSIQRTQEKYPETPIDFNFETLPDNPDMLVFKGNYLLLQTAFFNLIENACKYSDNQPVSCLINFDTSNLFITIKDKGIGIPEKDLASVFDVFYRAENTRAYKGSGLGLTLTKRIIELHKGIIRVQSKPNEGTIFTVTLKIEG